MAARKLSSVPRLYGSLGILMCLAPPFLGLGSAQSSELQPVERIPRAQFGVVGGFPLTANDLDALIFPSADEEERQAVLEGVTFFTKPHIASEGAGADANQPFCQGCHRNAEEVPVNARLITTSSPISRAARSTPTDFNFTALDPSTGDCTAIGVTGCGGRAADQDEAVDPRTGAITGTGRTAAFTIFGDFMPATDPAMALFDPLDGHGPHMLQPGFPFPTFNPVPGTGQQFGGVVQHVRPSVAACLPDRIPPLEIDTNLAGGTGFRRTVGERAAPPYVGRGLMEAISADDIMLLEDPKDEQGDSSLDDPSVFECPGGCIHGHHNRNSSTAGNAGVVGGDFPPRADMGAEVRLSRFGLRAAGPTLVQFVIGGMQGEVGFTSPLRPGEVNKSDINEKRPGCMGDADGVPETPDGKQTELPLSTVLSTRSLIRMTPPPEFGKTLLSLLNSANPARSQPRRSPAARVQRGAVLFGVDLVAFANRMIRGRMPAGGDNLDPHGRSLTDRKVNCVGCHTPIQKTGDSPAHDDPDNKDVGQKHLSNVWAPIFSDLLLHDMTIIDAERHAPTPRNPVLIRRVHLPPGLEHVPPGLGHLPPGLGHLRPRLGRGDRDEDGEGLGPPHPVPGLVFATFDLARNLADDTLPTQGAAEGYMWRTPPLMGLGRVGPPFLHDARVYLSRRTVLRTPAGTVMTSSEFTNAPLVVRTFDDALRAAIELHDLPPPDDAKTPNLPGAGCPVPPAGSTDVDYGPSPQDVICPPYDSDISKDNRSEAREVIRRYRALSPADQQALIEFLKEL